MGIATILKFVFSKTGMIVIVILAVSAFGFYIKHQLDTKDKLIETQKTSINILTQNQKKLETTIDTLNESIQAQAEISKQYNDSISFLNAANNEMSNELLDAKSKMQVRDLERLRDSSHSELVLKLINKSIRKQTLGWNQK